MNPSEFRDKSANAANEIAEVLQRVDTEQVENLIDALIAAPRVFVAGVGREGLAARAFAMRLMHLGLDVHVVWDDTTPEVGPDDAFLMVNGSGQIGHLLYLAERAIEAGGRLLQVSGVPPTVTSPEVSLTIPAAVYLGEGDVVASEQPMGSLFEQSALITFDVIIQMMMRRMGVSAERMAARHRNIE